MSLSAELRNRIYEFAVRPENDGDGGIDGCRAIFVSVNCVDAMHEREVSCGDYRCTEWMKQPAITKLSRQIRAESLSVYYGSNVFVIECKAEQYEPYEDRLKRKESKESTAKRLSWDFEYKGAERWLASLRHENTASLVKRLEVCYDPEICEFSHGSAPGNEDLLKDLNRTAHDLPSTTGLAVIMKDEDRHRQGYWVPTNSYEPEKDLSLPNAEGDSMAHRSFFYCY